jgi:hypothetical protein
VRGCGARKRKRKKTSQKTHPKKSARSSGSSNTERPQSQEVLVVRVGIVASC